MGRSIRRALWAGLLLLGASSPGWTTAAVAESALFPKQQRITESELDEIRGGFVLPNGMDISLGIEIQTLVNGALALRTVLTSMEPGVPSVFTAKSGASAGPASVTRGDGVTTTTLPGGGVVRVVEGAVSSPAPAEGEARIELTPNGPSVLTQLGSVQLEQDDRGAVVVLKGDSLELRHMIGNFTGSLVANTANDRSIDTVVTVNIDLHNSAVPIGNAMLRWESIAVDAAGRGVR
ncbi:hypothetical protein D3876_04685 [Sphingomonas cavernae]|uniref:Uncharacterized protein n=1 Tax=Sphingomonas cavernae TaxID=2320861 RepID=A0A418WQU4_9SPHN|nr:hypothetical protein D3876_04685 [Sphingomonas cavernae]